MRLFYRHVDQAERWENAQMVSGKAIIPASYTNSPFPLQYYFEVQHGSATPEIQPGLTPELNRQPYYVVRQT